MVVLLHLYTNAPRGSLPPPSYSSSFSYSFLFVL
ncbi:pQP383R 2 [African swine fever virus]|uniref:PQP383R 2 n=1 Tax=African swine fever virus TaxID=10497 RepID=A0A894KS39_ASF|nr:pQP383R 2 [African swine fever virus]